MCGVNYWIFCPCADSVFPLHTKRKREPGDEAKLLVNYYCYLYPGEVGMYFNGELYQNNSIISALDIDNHFTTPPAKNSLVCLTNRFPCCSGLSDGSWYNPDGSRTLEGLETGHFYQIYYQHQSTILHESASPSTSEGLFHCQIADKANATHDLYIGVYSSGAGK